MTENSSERTGGCLCGAVRYKATVTGTFSTCYCKMCQRWTAGVFMGAATQSFEVTQGEEDLVVVDTSSWAKRSFCSKCGSSIYYCMPQHGESVALGTLDDTSGLSNTVQYFSDKRPEGFSLAESTKEMTTEDIKAAFGLE